MMCTAPPAAAIAGENLSSPGICGLTTLGVLQVRPPSAETDSTMSFSPRELYRVSCHVAYKRPVDGSAAAAGARPVRMPGSSEPRNALIFTGAPQVAPPS